MSYICKISETTSVKRVINVDSKNILKENEVNMIQDYKVDSFKKPEVSTVITLIPERKPFTSKKLNYKKYSKKLDKNCFAKLSNKKNKNRANKNSVLTIDKYQTIKYIKNGPETSSFRLCYDQDKNKVTFLSSLLKYKNSKIDNVKNDLADNDIISDVLPGLEDFKKVYDKQVQTAAKVSYTSFSSDYNKTTKIYNSKRINLNIDKNVRHMKFSVTADVKKVDENNNRPKVNNLNFLQRERAFQNKIRQENIKAIAPKLEKKVIYRHDAKVVNMKVPLHNRCCESVKKAADIESGHRIEEVDENKNKWRLLNDANESFSLVKFGRDIQDNFKFLNKTPKDNLNKFFMLELGHVDMSINGHSITSDKNPKVILRKFKKMLPNLSDRKLVSCFSQEGVLAKSFFGVAGQYPDILKYTFNAPKISYKVNRINENSFEIDICSIAKSRPSNTYYNGVLVNKPTIDAYGMKTNIVVSKITNPIIRNLFFVK
ncbi:hypothetical protein RJI84_01995 [Buchnera aphidicola (Chaitoregma tattakana)]|uniref:hypothetical protein n=1 Tax=Buchnera aphidicola TaxID=9 RepID=UPI0031B8083F